MSQGHYTFYNIPMDFELLRLKRLIASISRMKFKTWSNGMIRGFLQMVAYKPFDLVVLLRHCTRWPLLLYWMESKTRLLEYRMFLVARSMTDQWCRCQLILELCALNYGQYLFTFSSRESFIELRCMLLSRASESRLWVTSLYYPLTLCPSLSDSSHFVKGGAQALPKHKSKSWFPFCYTRFDKDRITNQRAQEFMTLKVSNIW